MEPTAAPALDRLAARWRACAGYCPDVVSTSNLPAATRSPNSTGTGPITDGNGKATLTYVGQTASAGFLQGHRHTQRLRVGVQLGGANAPRNAVPADTHMQLPATFVVRQATVTVAAKDETGAPAAQTAITLNVAGPNARGPGTVTFEGPTKPTTRAIFTEPGIYFLQITATDSLGSNAAQVGPIIVEPPIATEQGWIGTPADGSHVTGIVPITVASGVTLTSGALTVYPVSNPSAVATLNPATTGSGQIGQLDMTLFRPDGAARGGGRGHPKDSGY